MIGIIAIFEVERVVEGVKTIAMIEESRSGVSEGRSIESGIPNQMRMRGLNLSAHHRRFRLSITIASK